jgi:transposase InsO family protein
MRANGLCAKAGERYKSTTDSHHSFPIAKNIVNRNFAVRHQDKVWVSDITHIKTGEGWVYIALVMDLFSRRIVGWAQDRLLTTGIVQDALQQSIQRRSPPEGLIIHTDQGCQYASHPFRNLLTHHGFILSMSRKGDCYDNACMESFIHTLKVELVHSYLYKTREEVRGSLFEYIEMYYNYKRKHSTLDYRSPIEFENVKK